MEQGEPQQAPPPPGGWSAWRQRPGDAPAPPAGQAPPVPHPYYGQTPYYGAPPEAAWPRPPAQIPHYKAPPGEHPRELPWRLAGWWSRVGAQILDLLIIWVPGGTIIGLLIAAAEGADSSGSERTYWIATIVASFLVMAAHLFYAPLLMRRKGRHNGQTIGKQATGIRVIRADGEPMRFAHAALRQIVFKSFGGFVASTFIPIFPWILNYLWPTWDEQHRALHDLAADTRVVAA